MNLAHKSYVSFEEYIKIKESSDFLIEYLDGVILMAPSPSTKHQRISGKLNTKLMIFLEGKPCEVFQAPYDIELKREGIEGKRIVIPDLSVICDKEGFTENNYVGVPSLIIEILSPSNQSHDLITKLNLYMQYGVKEYWIVNPMKDAITIYVLNSEGLYEQADIKVGKGIIESSFLEGFTINLEYLFN
ncbi:Uma2 family endonuclease [Desnuesiella massiliensis]|uniref:Uma2 family endonuclease n=1 Tax=Desnuesiella massiliensis TaxID=1650662 RepID=UPI0006E18CDE|nr:Uma2 family endonuclease [Desnuesiella massiliensis]